MLSNSSTPLPAGCCITAIKMRKKAEVGSSRSYFLTRNLMKSTLRISSTLCLETCNKSQDKRDDHVTKHLMLNVEAPYCLLTGRRDNSVAGLLRKTFTPLMSLVNPPSKTIDSALRRFCSTILLPYRQYLSSIPPLGQV